MLLLIIVLLLLFGGGGGYYAHNAWGPLAGGSVFGTVIIILVVLWAAGILKN